MGQAGRDSAEARADGLDWQLENTTAAVPSRSATIAPGMRLERARQRIIASTVPAASASRLGERVETRGQSFHALPENARDLGELQAEEILDLGAGDQDGDAVGEADDDGRGMNFTAVPMPVSP